MIDDTEATRREKYDMLINNSAVCWHKLYIEEKNRREELEERYNSLVKQIRKHGKDRINEADNFLRTYARSWH